jgi:hypothetical protein
VSSHAKATGPKREKGEDSVDNPQVEKRQSQDENRGKAREAQQRESKQDAVVPIKARRDHDQTPPQRRQPRT